MEHYDRNVLRLVNSDTFDSSISERFIISKIIK